MSGEKDLQKLIRELKPILNSGEYVFATVPNFDGILRTDTLYEFKEAEGITIVLEKNKADALKLSYQFTSSWITLEIHSSLEAVGLTAAFSTELTKYNISCNVVAGFYHDHIFVDTKDAKKSMEVLTNLSKNK
ncbi:ACT domain-containing protein [Polaribacter pectinis]|uniref:ACT domain-containing protein n=1 Tax=Polaribacter pectinis TaxID=2738844 RepID=A0A7G9L8P7_9FLAO|nr:ACT domain-containing protein [Polaribacter pectinis]QNM84996.1 ACT domain-containing protein [Polaribacter pectinis]